VSVAAIILAAGESRRMGSAKALLPFRGGTFLSTLAGTLSCCCSPVYAVFGFAAEEMMAAAPASVVALENPAFRQGMLTSLQAALRVMSVLPERVLFTLVDHPAVKPGTVSQLVRVEAELVIPRHGGKRGHPVVIAPGIAREIIAEPVTSKLSDVIGRHAAAIRYVDLEDDPGICDDIDDPQLYQALLAREAPASQELSSRQVSSYQQKDGGI
jgi:molybdenum cofactor cytidylyltransferase